jgi:bilirubin oxidase
MKRRFEEKYGVRWEPGTATFQYDNEQPPATLWYHDHALGMTRTNVYSGPAGFYLLRDGEPKPCRRDGGEREDGGHGRSWDRDVDHGHDGDDDGHGDGDDDGGSARVECRLPGPAPAVAGGDDAGVRPHEIPIVVQDRSFREDGSLFYPDSRAFFDGFTGPYIPESDVPPIWNPEFFGDTMVVNGRTWPVLEVEPRRYRLRFLNGTNARFLILKIVTDPVAERPVAAALPFWQIGADAGFLAEPVRLDELRMGNAERADTIVDFTRLKPGTELYLVNEGPDEPFGGGEPVTDFPPANPETTGQVMKLVVVPREGKDRSVPAKELALPSPGRLGETSKVRKVSLNEESSTVFDGPVMALLGTLGEAGDPVPLEWDDPITENPALHATELWEIHNFTADAHPIHPHATHLRVVSRQSMTGGLPSPPAPWETGPKDTVIALPGEITRIRVRFDLPGLFVWHCHILEHEDNEMMRPLFIGRNPPDLDEPPTGGGKPVASLGE